MQRAFDWSPLGLQAALRTVPELLPIGECVAIARWREGDCAAVLTLEHRPGEGPDWPDEIVSDAEIWECQNGAWSFDQSAGNGWLDGPLTRPTRDRLGGQDMRILGTGGSGSSACHAIYGSCTAAVDAVQVIAGGRELPPWRIESPIGAWIVGYRNVAAGVVVQAIDHHGTVLCAEVVDERRDW